MFKNVFYKTLYEKRWGMFWWAVAMFATTLLIVWLFPTFRDSFGASLENVPESLKSILGEAADYQRIEGFIELQVLLQMVFYTIIYGVFLCTGLIAGEEGQGTLQTLLTNPINRTKVYFQKLAAGALILWVVTFAMFLAIWAGTALIDVPINVSRMLQGTFALWLLTMVFSVFSYMVGAITGKRGLSGGVAGVFAFASYLVTSLSGTVHALRSVNYLSPFKYFSNPRILDNGLQLDNVSILAGACIAFMIFGWVMFRYRDIYQR